jgi:hypothetical protein
MIRADSNPQMSCPQLVPGSPVFSNPPRTRSNRIIEWGDKPQGTVSIPVEARQSPFYFSVEIPRAIAPQRYEIQTSLR